jgi:hypothetical protein
MRAGDKDAKGMNGRKELASYISIENNFSPYTVHFLSVCTITQKMHSSDSLLVKFYICYMFRRMYVIIREFCFVCPAEFYYCVYSYVINVKRPLLSAVVV